MTDMSEWPEKMRGQYPDDEAMLKQISGALRSAIDHHGPITKDLIPSAAKRILGQINGYLAERNALQQVSGGTP